MNELVHEILSELAIPEPNSGCYLWDGHTSTNGYGKLKRNGKMLYAHRYVYRLVHGEIPGDMFVCHHCDVPSCINPEHLFLGTHADNQADMKQKGKYRNNAALRDFCANGHRRTEENTYLFNGKGYCRDCRRLATQARYQRDPDKARAYANKRYHEKKSL